MKLVYVHSAALPGLAANTVHVAKMCSAFAGNGHEVALICPPTRVSDGNVAGYYGLSHGFRIWRCPRPAVSGGPHIFAWLSAGLARLSGAELLYSRDIFAAAAGLQLGLDVIFEAHSPFPVGSRGARLFRGFANYSNFKRLVVISGALAADLKETFPWLEGRVMVAHDGADPADIQRAHPRAAGSAFSVAYAGHLYPGKGMEIIAPLAGLCRWADFHVYGGTSDDVFAWSNKLRHLSNLTFYGHVPHGALPELLAVHDAVLAPYQQRVSISDGGKTNVSRWMSPLKLFEYMALGLPIVCSDLPVLREILRNDDTALMCPPDDPAAWEMALIRLRDNPALAKVIGARACGEFLAHYTWLQRAKNVLEGVASR